MNRTDILDVVSRKLAPFIMMLGLYLFAYGHISPGGGFQGGVVLASGAVLLLLGSWPARTAGLFPVHAVGLVEAAGLALFLALGAMGVALGRGFLGNALPTRPSGGVLDAPLVFLLNGVIGLKVGAGITLICAYLFRGDVG